MVKNRWIHAFTNGISTLEMQTASSRIWTRVVDSISYDDNRYTKSLKNWNAAM